MPQDFLIRSRNLWRFASFPVSFGAGIGVVANWKYADFAIRLKIPFVEMEFVEFFPWEVCDFVPCSSFFMNPTNNYAAFFKYREKHQPKIIWRPKRFRLCSDQPLFACGQFVNYPLPSDTPDADAIVSSTGQVLRITNCEIIVSLSPKNPPYAKPLGNGVAIKAGHELLA